MVSSMSSAHPPIADVVRDHIRDIADFPTAGVTFKDFTPLLASPQAFRAVTDDVCSRYAGSSPGEAGAIDLVVGIEARGFVLGAAVAYALGAGFVPLRKPGKLPGPTVWEAYDLEYGSTRLHAQRDGIPSGARVLLMDDVLATGGTAAAACRLVDRLGATVVAVDVVLELSHLQGRGQLSGRTVHAILTV